MLFWINGPSNITVILRPSQIHERILKWSKSFASSSFTKEVGPEHKIKSICPSSHVCWGVGGNVKQVHIMLCGLEAVFKCQCSGVFQGWLQLVHMSSDWSSLLFLQAADTGAGDNSCKDRDKNPFVFESVCQSMWYQSAALLPVPSSSCHYRD